MITFNLMQVQKEMKNILDINVEKLSSIDFIVAISRGGLIPGVLAAIRLEKPLAVAYIDPKDNVYFDRVEWIKDKTILIVDDICRSGKTMNKVFGMLEKYTQSIETMVMFKLNKSMHNPTYSFLTNDDIKFPWD